MSEAPNKRAAFDVAAMRAQLMARVQQNPQAAPHVVHANQARLETEFAATDAASKANQEPPPVNDTHAVVAGSDAPLHVLADQSDVTRKSSPLRSQTIEHIQTLISPQTDFEATISPLMELLGWAGELRRVREALPHFDRVHNIEMLRAFLARLDYETSYQYVDLEFMRADLLPCICELDSTLYLVSEKAANGTLLAFNAKTRAWMNIAPDRMSGDVLTIRKASRNDREMLKMQQNWLGAVIARFKPIIGMAILLSFLINVAALCVPFFVVHVYDLGIASRSGLVVFYLAIGAGIVILGDLSLRYIRARVMAYFGSRVDALIGMTAFQQLVQMPISMVESAQIGTQISRLRQFESMRDTFIGSLATAIIDIPFVAVFLVTIAYFGGHLVWVPVSLLTIFVVLSFITLPLVKSSSNELGDVKQRLQLLVREIVGMRQIIRDMNVENVWAERHRELLDEWSRKSQRALFISNMTQNIAQALVSISGIATLTLGAIWVMSGAMTPGALVGAMALVWRVLSPLQTTYLSITRLEQALQTITQINRLMSIPTEFETRGIKSFHRSFGGNVTLSRLVFRYPRRIEPALRGIQVQIKAGEVIAITGTSGSGKTTLLKLILGLYPPMGGAVLADGLDLRQIAPAEWRSSVAFLPEQIHFYYGTIAQNMRLACPDASDAQLTEALKAAGVDLQSALLPDGIETRLTSSRLESLPDAVKQSIALARCFLKQSPLYLLDNPGANVDQAGAAAMVKKINELKGRSTIILTTFRPAYMRLADRVIVLNEGLVVADGPPDDIIQKLSSAA